jgi:hypothetical protein
MTPAVLVGVRLGLGAPAAATLRRLPAVEHLERRAERVGGAPGPRRAGALVALGQGAAARGVGARVPDAAEAAVLAVVRALGIGKVTRRAAPGHIAPARCVVRSRRHGAYCPVPLVCPLVCPLLSPDCPLPV